MTCLTAIGTAPLWGLPPTAALESRLWQLATGNSNLATGNSPQALESRHGQLATGNPNLAAGNSPRALESRYGLSAGLLRRERLSSWLKRL